jgi:fatty acid CoA ligase FadD9
VTNHADDGLSLDVFVDWIEAAGHPIERVGTYDEWLHRFDVALRSMPENERQLSSHQVLDSMRHPAPARGVVPGSRRFDDALRSLEIGPTTPRITHEYFTKCLDDMVRLGLVPSADRA